MLTHSASSRVGTSHRDVVSMFESRVLVLLSACLIAALGACSEPTERIPVRVEVEADEAVRELADEVSIVVETQADGRGGWVIATSQRFEPKVMDGFPLELAIGAARFARTNYLVTATARDDRGSIVAEARALRDWEDFDRGLIYLRFEAACVRRMTLCPKGETCHGGDCIDAHYEAARGAPDDPSEPAGTQDAGMEPPGPTMATEGETCEPEGARSCTEEGSRIPLTCAEGTWRPESMCGEDELCDMTPGAQRGTCRQIANECRGQRPNVPFCDRETMRVCANSFSSDTRPCGPNERCVASNEARCECSAGFVRGATGCERPTDCSVDNGGCDRLTMCTMRDAERVCSECPAGYGGTGESGCEPLLAGLTPSAGELGPSFDPTVHRYRVNVALLTQRLTLTPNAPSAARVELNGTAVASGEAWTTPILPFGEYPVKLTLTSQSGEASDYEVIIERGGTQSAYLKASNTGGNDEFGVSLAMSGDTLVVGAYGEDSAATKIGGDQADNAASAAGAAYVFVRRGDQWEQQAYLKASDTAADRYFGGTVAIDGDTIVVAATGTHGRELSTDRPGVAYVFTRSAGQWSETARLTSPTSADGDLFGRGVALEGDTLALGAPGEGNGAVYLFTRSAGDWKPQGKIAGEPSMAGSAFGGGLALSKDTLLVSAPLDNRPLEGTGSAYVYLRKGADWQLQQRLTPDPASGDALFGFAIAVRGDLAVVGAPRREALTTSLVNTEPGEAFVFQRAAGTWTQTQRMRSLLPYRNDAFGSSVALSDDGLLIGACNEASGSRGIGGDASRRDMGYSGAAYLYARESNTWKLSAYLKASNTDAFDSFGWAVALSGKLAVVGANWEASKSTGINGDLDDNSMRGAGAVYVFE